MRWVALIALLASACTGPQDPPTPDSGLQRPDAARADQAAGDRGGSDAGLADSAALLDVLAPDAATSDAGSEDALFAGCAFDFDQVTLRAVNERRWLRQASGESAGATADPLNSVTSSAPQFVQASLDHGTAALRAVAAGNASIALVSSSAATSATVVVDLTDSIFASAVTEVSYGTGAGFGQQNMPAVVYGPPKGSGAAAGSLDVVSLGLGGSITIELGVDVVDGPGADLIVFENPFVGFLEPGQVAVSVDGTTFVEFACDAATYVGCAGVTPVRASADNGTDPTDPAAAGGDAFDLADVSLARAHFVRITDVGGVDTGGGKAGFDLDAVVAIHSVPHADATLTGPASLRLGVGASRSPRYDVNADARTQFGALVACSAQPVGVVEVSCGCTLTGRTAGDAIVTARLGDMTQQLTVTVSE